MKKLLVLAGVVLSLNAHAQSAEDYRQLQINSSVCERAATLAKAAAGVRVLNGGYSDYMELFDNLVAKDPSREREREFTSTIGQMVFNANQVDPVKAQSAMRRTCLNNTTLYRKMVPWM